MFYKVKTKLIEKNIAKKNLSNPFNYESAESYELSKDASKWINNSYYFSAHEGDKSFFCRLGIRINQLETWFVILDGDDKYCLKEELFEVGSSPLKVIKEAIDDLKGVHQHQPVGRFHIIARLVVGFAGLVYKEVLTNVL